MIPGSSGMDICCNFIKLAGHTYNLAVRLSHVLFQHINEHVVPSRWTCMRNQRLRASMLPVSRPQLGRRSAAAYHSRPRNLQPLQQANVHDSANITDRTTLDRHSRTLVLSPSFLHTGLMPLVDDRGVQINTPNPAQSRNTRGRRVSALDVDEGGRRGGAGDRDGAGDELPAYEVGKSPPGYHTASGNTARPDIVEVELPERTDRSVQHSEETPDTDPSHSQAAPPNSCELGGVSPLPLDSTPQYHPPMRELCTPLKRSRSTLTNLNRITRHSPLCFLYPVLSLTLFSILT